MKSLFYALVLLAVIAGSLILLRSLEPTPVREEARPPVTASEPSAHAVERRVPLTTPAQTEAMSVEQLLASGERLMRSWRPREAMVMLEQLVDADSTQYQGWVWLVECYSDPLVGREDSARGAWQHARRFVTSERDTTFLAGLRALFLEADYLSAVGSLTTASRFDPPVADVHFYLARANYMAGRLDDARTQVERLVEADPRDGRATDLSVRVMVAGGDLDRAAQRGRELAREHAAEPFPYVLLAQVEMLRGESAAAIEFCNNALIIDPRYVPAIVTRATLYARSGHPRPARVSFEKLLLFDDPILQGVGQAGIAFVNFHSGEFGRGMDAMDEAIRHAIMAGAVRRGLSYASSLVGYLCALGQADRAAEIVDRWITGFGDVPVQLGSLRIHIQRGDLDAARRSLVNITADKDWLVWARVLSLDPIELSALTHIAAGDHAEALSLLTTHPRLSVGAGVKARRAFVRGYAAFESGDAEAAVAAFATMNDHLYGVEFPYYGDPVLDVQSLFFLAEAALAAGSETEARERYQEFLGLWGDASWDLPAVTRAREKLSSLEATTGQP